MAEKIKKAVSAYPLILPKATMEALKTKAWRKRTTVKALLTEIITKYLDGNDNDA